jgi:hypothetical protein
MNQPNYACLMKDLAREFLNRLAAEEASQKLRMETDNAGLGMLTAIKEFDFYCYNYVRNEQTEDTDIHVHLLQLGLPKLVTAVLSAHASFIHPTVTFRSDQSLILAALDVVSAFGMIEQGRRFAHAAMAGECEIVRFSERQYDIVMPETVYNMEQHEAEVKSHYTRLHQEDTDAMVKQTFGGIMGEIDSLLREKVYVFRDYFIGYDAHPVLDDFFYGLATLELQNQDGFDTFHRKLKFGGVTMQKFALAVTYFLSLALKHEKFAEVLTEKAPHIRLRDILTITTPRHDFEENLIEAVNKYGTSYEGYEPLSPDEAQIILQVLSLRRDNLEVMLPTLSPIPFLIEYSDSSWITSVASVQTSAFPFLLNSLRHCFPADYDRNQRTREKSMQRALRRLFDEYLPGLTLVDNVGVTLKGKLVTDIDFAAVDPKDGTVILFQLKHQDPYGGDMRRRSNRAGRLRTEVAHWLEAMRTWRTEEPRALRRALRLGSGVECNRVCFVIVAKHFAHFLSTADLRDDAAYATWVQLFDALNRQKGEGGPISLRGLFDILQRFMSHKMAKGYVYDLEDSYHLPSLSYRVRSSMAHHPT